MIKQSVKRFSSVISRRFMLALCILLFVASCNSSSSNDYTESFDIPLINKYEYFRQRGDYKSVMQISKEYLKNAEEKKYTDGEALCYAVMASINARVGKYKEAMPLYLKANKILQNSENNIVKSFFYNEYARLHLIVDLYAYALDYNNKAIYSSERIENKKIRIFLLNKVYLLQGSILDALNKNESALQYFHKALKVRYTPAGDTYIAQHHLFYTKNIDSIAIYITHALNKLEIKDESLIDASITYSIAGAYYREIGDFGKSKAYHLRALKILDDKPDFSKSNNYVYVYADLENLVTRMKNQEEKQFYYVKVNKAKENIDWDRPDMISILNDHFTSDTEAKSKRDIIIYTLPIFAGIMLVGFFIYKRIKLLKIKRKQLENGMEDLKLQMEDTRFNEIMELARKNDPAFLIRFTDLYPNFTSKLLGINPELEKTELIFAAMVKMNFSSKEIAQNLGILHTSVQRRKNRIRKRLNLPSDEDLYNFFNTLT